MRTVGVLTRSHLRERRYSPDILSFILSSSVHGKSHRLANVKNSGKAVDRTGSVSCQDWSGHAQITGFSDVVSHPARTSMYTRNELKMRDFSVMHSIRGGLHSFHSASGGAGEWVTYDLQAFSRYYRHRPFQVAYRAVIIISEVVMLSLGHVTEKDIHKRAEKPTSFSYFPAGFESYAPHMLMLKEWWALQLKRSLIRLGPFYIKLGQALSTRPDILPRAYCQELAKLQDHVPPYPTSLALQYLESELGSPASKLYAYITPEPVAAASLGQVYKAHLHSGELVAVKVQRPGVTARLALDAYLLGLLGGALQRFAGARPDLIAMINEMVERMFEEVDYVLEGQYAERFSKLYGINQDDVQEDGPLRGLKRISLKASRGGAHGVVKVPQVYWDLTSRGVLTMEWINGLKLTDAEALKKANLETKQIVDQGVFCSLRQLLEEGFFHADPHPGNLVVTEEGVLAYFDFGMMSEIRKEYRIGLIRTIVHFVNRDSLGLAKDFMVLGFIPRDTDIAPIAEALHRSFGEEGTRTRLDFQGIMTQLSDVMYQFKFRLPPEYAMVIRALGSLEGTATTLDPDFKVVASAYPFIVGRLLADPDPDMREILRELLIRNNGSIRWHRLERLVFAIAEQSTSADEKENDARAWSGRDGLGGKAAAGIKGSFSTRAVASATIDVFNHILSGKGLRTRTILVQDITQTFDHLLGQAIAEMLDFSESLADVTPTTASLDLQDVFAPASVTHENPEGHDSRAHKEVDWSQFALAGYWREMARKKFIRKLSENFESKEGVNTELRREVDSHPYGDLPKDNFGTGHERKAQESKDDSSGSGESKVDDFGNRVKRGFQAFGNTVNSAPEIWIPLITRLACRQEARSLAVAIASSLGDVYCRRTSEASFLLMSKALHKRDLEKKADSQHDI